MTCISKAAGHHPSKASGIVVLCFFGSRSSHPICFISGEGAQVSWTIPISPKIPGLFSRLSLLESSHNSAGDELQDPFRVWNQAEVMATAMPTSHEHQCQKRALNSKRCFSYFISVSAVDNRSRFLAGGLTKTQLTGKTGLFETLVANISSLDHW